MLYMVNFLLCSYPQSAHGNLLLHDHQCKDTQLDMLSMVHHKLMRASAKQQHTFYLHETMQAIVKTISIVETKSTYKNRIFGCLWQERMRQYFSLRSTLVCVAVKLLSDQCSFVFYCIGKGIQIAFQGRQSQSMIPFLHPAMTEMINTSSKIIVISTFSTCVYLSHKQ